MLLGALLGASGCLGGMGRSPDPFTGGANAGTGRLTVEVQNLNFNDLAIFAVRSGEQIRLGRVTGKSDARFTTEWNFAHPVRFRVDIVGGETCATRELTVDPGGRVFVQIPANIGMSPCLASRR